MTLQKRMVLQRRVNYRIKCRKDKLIRCLPVSQSFRFLQTTYSQMIGICKYFCAVQSWHMLFWLLKDAWLTCNRCSLSVLPTPFWSPIKHLLQTTWQPIDWLLVTDLLFALVFYICRWYVWNYVMTFQTLVCILNVLKWKGCFASEGDDRMDSWLPCPCILFYESLWVFC